MDTIAGFADAMLSHRLSDIDQWHEWEIRLPVLTPPGADGGILMGCPVWGEAYLERFLRFGVPTLLEPENRAALAGARLILYMDLHDDPGLREAIKAALEPHVAVDCRIIPRPLVVHMKEDRRAMLAMLGTIHGVILSVAGQRGMDFHMLQPDHHYAQGFFANLRRLGRHHDAIVQSGLSATLDVIPDLEAAGGSIEPGELGALGFRHLHPQQQWMVMNANGRNTRTALPRSNWLAWRSKDELVIHNAHMHLSYLSAKLCRAAKPTAPHTLDTRLPFLATRFYVPKPSDGLVFLELSGSGKQHSTEAIGFRAFALNWWRIALFKHDTLPFFRTPCRVPIGHDPKGMPGWAIRWQAGRLVRRLVKARTQAMEDLICGATGV